MKPGCHFYGYEEDNFQGTMTVYEDATGQGLLVPNNEQGEYIWFPEVEGCSDYAFNSYKCRLEFWGSINSDLKYFRCVNY